MRFWFLFSLGFCFLVIRSGLGLRYWLLLLFVVVRCWLCSSPELFFSGGGARFGSLCRLWCWELVGFRCFCGLGVVPRRSSSFSGDGFWWYWFRVFCDVKVFGIGGGLVVMVFVGGGSERGSVVVEATRCRVGTSGGGKKGLLFLVWMGVDGWGLVQGWSGRRRGG
ncbi:hypothetical protein QL285_031455 [Trifolium repens]|nr:hypothetical protein QL285_031455 [Trifolium repens]